MAANLARRWKHSPKTNFTMLSATTPVAAKHILCAYVTREGTGRQQHSKRALPNAQLIMIACLLA